MPQRNADLGRYVRQMQFPPIGREGQLCLSQSRALLCGCGALGGTAANLLVRAGVGMLRIVDRDRVELNNLQRQSLFDETDAQDATPKALAAAEKLRAINSEVTIEPIVGEITHRSIESFFDGVDIVLDGTDNFETRFLMNDAAVKRNVPWVFGGCVGAEGQSMTIIPGKTPCLRCLMPDCPEPGTVPTCVAAGVLGSIVRVVAAIEACEAIKLLTGHCEAVSRELVVVDLWQNQWRRIDLGGLRDRVDCPACRHGEFKWLYPAIS
jgi:molybdopterin-synthase adenylyltransferase